MVASLHTDEIFIDEDLVRGLLSRQFPDLASLPLHALNESGSTNVIFRLGDDLLVRLPRQPGGGAAIDKECRWGSEIGRKLSINVPQVIAVGEPGEGYGEAWSIARWLVGERPRAYRTGDVPTPASSMLAADLADVIAELRAIEVSQAVGIDPALRGYRGRALVEFSEWMHINIRKCRSIAGLDLDLDRAEALWSAALSLPEAQETGPDRWYHGDLVAENLLLVDGRLAAVLDFGGVSVGDPTIDLHGAWELFDPPAREVFRERLQVEEAQWTLGRAWALGIALGVFAYYWETMPSRREDRLCMARAALADAPL